jgi:apolipoprotein N-acyltransferase
LAPFRLLRGVVRFLRIDVRLWIALGSGLLLSIAFPKGTVAALAWIAPGLLLLTAAGHPGVAAFRVGYFGGLAFHLTSLYWLLFNPFPAGAAAGWLALSGVLSLFQGVWVWLGWRAWPVARTTVEPGWANAVDALLNLPWWRRTCWSLVCAALWVGLEMTQARVLGGFPWNFLGVSQYRLVPLTQIAAFTGVYGVSFLVAWCSVSLALAVLRLGRQTSSHWGWMIELRLPLLAVVGVGCFGLARLNPMPETGRSLTVALVQPSIPQVLIWDHREDSNRFAKVMDLSRLALATRPDLLVWPESAMPNFTEDNVRAITNLVATERVWMVLGADDAERRVTAEGKEETDYFNAAFLFDPEGRYVARYRKQRLVMFGEFVPLARWLPLLKHLTPIEGGFTPGPGPVPFELADPKCRLAVLICFEDVFPDLARRAAGADIDFLLNLTNDGWFGESAAQWQQAANASFRAIENGLPVVRSTNNGLTCWVDPAGRVRQILGEPTGDVYSAGFLTARIPLLPTGQRREPTFYTRHGDAFGWGCVVAAVLAAGGGFLGRRHP